jgi:hypothetical protein
VVPLYPSPQRPCRSSSEYSDVQHGASTRSRSGNPNRVRKRARYSAKGDDEGDAPMESEGDLSNNSTTSSYRLACSKCWRPPVDGNKLRACSGCLVIKYCSVTCQREAWPDHKLVCQGFGAARERNLAADGQKESAPGRSAKRIAQMEQDALTAWYCNNSGLSHNVQSLAWTP